MPRSRIHEVSRLPVVRRVLVGLVVGLVTGLVIDIARGTGTFAVVEGATANWRTVETADPDGNDPRIVVVSIDQSSLDYLARDTHELRDAWPWQRSQFNLLIDYCRRAGAGVVVFDILFTESGTDTEKTDNAFAIGVGASENVVVGSEFSHHLTAWRAGREAFTQQYALDADLEPPDGGERWPLPLYRTATPPIRQLVEGIVVSENLGALIELATCRIDFHMAPDDFTFRKRYRDLAGMAFTGRPAPGVGVVNVREDADSTFRRYHLLHAHTGASSDVDTTDTTVVHAGDTDAIAYNAYPSLALAAARLLQRGPDGNVPSVQRHDDRLVVGAYSVPLQRDGSLILRFPAPTDEKGGMYPRIPFEQIHQAAEIELMRDRVEATWRWNLLLAASETARFGELAGSAFGPLGDLDAMATDLRHRIAAVREIDGEPTPLVQLQRRFEGTLARVRIGSSDFPSGTLSAELTTLFDGLAEQTGSVPGDIRDLLDGVMDTLAGGNELTGQQPMMLQHALARGVRECVVQVAREATDAIEQFTRRADPLWRRFLDLESDVVADVDAWLATAGDALLADPPPDDADPALVAFARTASAMREAYRNGIDRLPEPALPTGALTGKIVFVGGFAAGLKDVRRTPFNGKDAGVYLHATALDNLLNGNYVRRQSPAWRSATTIGLAILASLAMLAFASTPLGLLANVLLSAGYTGLALGVHTGRNPLWIELVAPLLALGIATVVAGAAGYLLVGRDRRRLLGAMSQYMGRELVQVVERNPDRLRLGGEERTVTVYFSDVAGFTTISEQLDPHQLTELMNRYLSRMTNVILRTGGIIDKYIGDAIMAIWNAPFDLESSAATACHAAIDCQRELVALRKELVAAGYPVLSARAGLNTGVAKVGNMGSDLRFSYTAMGNTVNLAARLEPACKDYGASILIGDQTFRDARGAILARNVDRLQVKGKSEAVPVHELLGKAGEADDEMLDWLSRWDEAMQRYYGRDFTEAVKAFEQCQALRAGDVAAESLIARCCEMIENPPPSDWDGRWIKTSKG